MGTWGVGVYDNDMAADWAHELVADGLAAVTAAFDAVADTEYVDADDGVAAVAAADVIARLKSGGGEQTPYCESVIDWVAQNPGPPSDALVVSARATLERVRGDESELAELWADTDSLDEWLATLDAIDRRLA